MISIQELFEPAIQSPDIELKRRFNRLVGLEDQKERLTKMLSLLVNPNGIEKWAKKFHPNANIVLSNLFQCPPLIVLEGDVGSGKTELATTIGDAVARQENIEITLLPLSLSARGQGMVGEMTKLITSVFDHTINQAQKYKSRSGKSRSAVILLIDEADALAQSRENVQMHHEDKAGVNAFIRGIDRLAHGQLPAAVIMCTNRMSTLDPAIKRRAAEILRFGRPSEEQRLAVLKAPLTELGLKKEEIQVIVTATGPQKGLNYGFTFSDLMQRLLPSIILKAYPSNPVTPENALEIIQGMQSTPPFIDK